jgi:hypothetical protein
MRDIYKKENSDTRSDNEDNRSVLLGMSVLDIFPELNKWVQYF